ncbi:NucA/NucB deoxyribonuclease domain-containing protein [Streptomyces galilaeus]
MGRLIGSIPAADMASDAPQGLNNPIEDFKDVCVDVPADTPTGKAGGVRSCTELSSLAESTRAAKIAPSSAAAANAVTACSAAVNSYNFERMSYCGNINLTTTTIDSKGATIGTAVMEVSSSGTLNPMLGAWEETETLTLVEATGVSVESNVSFTASCTSSTCSATVPNPWVNGTPMVEGQTLEGIITFEDVPNEDVQDFAALQYAVTAVPPGTTPDKPATWTTPRKVRCDSTKDSTGCAIADVTPIAEFSLTDQGAAAATYEWALLNLKSHPGQAGFTYLTDVGDAKRNRTCGTASSIAFVPNTAVVNDSCDEYPFASTSEGGLAAGFAPRSFRNW